MYRCVTRFIRKRLFVGLACALLGGAAWAAPEDDYELGKKRFSDGDVVGAMQPLKLAADAGHAGAQWLYGYLLDISDFDVEAVEYYKKSADQGNADGQFSYGIALTTGEGVQKNQQAGEGWIKRAAESGLRDAISAMALMYLGRGDGGDKAEALKWINKAVDNNFVPAIEGLAAAYREGKFGLPVDAKIADDLMKKSLEAQGVDVSGKRKRRVKK